MEASGIHAPAIQPEPQAVAVPALPESTTTAAKTQTITIVIEEDRIESPKPGPQLVNDDSKAVAIAKVAPPTPNEAAGVRAGGTPVTDAAPAARPEVDEGTRLRNELRTLLETKAEAAKIMPVAEALFSRLQTLRKNTADTNKSPELKAEIKADQQLLLKTAEVLLVPYKQQCLRHELERSALVNKALGFSQDLRADIWAVTDANVKKYSGFAEKGIAQLNVMLKAANNTLAAAQKAEKEPSDSFAAVIKRQKGEIAKKGLSPKSRKSAKTIALGTQIQALQGAVKQLQEAVKTLANRETILQKNINDQLTSLDLYAIAGKSSGDFWNGMEQLGARFGLEVPLRPAEKLPFEKVAAIVVPFIEETRRRQLNVYSTAAALLNRHFDSAIEGVRWQGKGEQAVPVIPHRAPGGPGSEINWPLFTKQYSATMQRLEQVAGVSPLDELSLAAFNEFALAEKSETRVRIWSTNNSSLFAALRAGFEHRHLIKAPLLDWLASCCGSSTGLMGEAELRALVNDYTKPITLRETARMVLTNPELRQAAGLNGASHFPVSALRDLAALCRNFANPEIKGAVPLHLFYAEGKNDCDKVWRFLHNKDLAGLKSMLEQMPLKKRQWVCCIYDAVHGDKALEKNLVAAFGGRDLGTAMAYLDRETLSEAAANLHYQLRHPGAAKTKRLDDRFVFANSAPDIEQAFLNYRNEFDTFMNSLYGAAPPQDLVAPFRAAMQEAKDYWDAYKNQKKAGNHSEMERLEVGLCKRLAAANDLFYLMYQGSDKARARGHQRRDAAIKVAVAAAAMGATALTMGIAAPAATTAGAVLTATGAVGAGLGTGTLVGFSFSVAKQLKSRAPFSWSTVGSETFDSLGTATSSSLSAALPAGIFARLGKSGKALMEVAKNPLLNYGATGLRNGAILSASRGVANASEMAVRKLGGDDRGAAAIAANTGWDMLHMGVAGAVAAPLTILTKSIKAGVVIDSAAAYAQHKAWQRLHGDLHNDFLLDVLGIVAFGGAARGSKKLGATLSKTQPRGVATILRPAYAATGTPTVPLRAGGKRPVVVKPSVRAASPPINNTAARAQTTPAPNSNTSATPVTEAINRPSTVASGPPNSAPKTAPAASPGYMTQEAVERLLSQNVIPPPTPADARRPPIPPGAYSIMTRELQALRVSFARQIHGRAALNAEVADYLRQTNEIMARAGMSPRRRNQIINAQYTNFEERGVHPIINAQTPNAANPLLLKTLLNEEVRRFNDTPASANYQTDVSQHLKNYERILRGTPGLNDVQIQRILNSRREDINGITGQARNATPSNSGTNPAVPKSNHNPNASIDLGDATQRTPPPQPQPQLRIVTPTGSNKV